MSDPHVIARITPQTLRRVMAAGFPGTLGLLLIYLTALSPPASVPMAVFLFGTGGGALVLAQRLWAATSVTLELTEEVLREAGPNGRILARIEDIKAIDRGFFAFKPASGFTARLHSKHGRVYAPGLWWRAGRRLMVGGATAGSEAKAVADTISIMLATRDTQS